MNCLYDSRTDCYSVLVNLPVKKYLELVDAAHSAKGGLAGQREPLKTKTARRIRERMVSDIKNGAVLPPVVLGVVLKDGDFQSFSGKLDQELDALLPEYTLEDISIIDGMQRTQAIKEALSEDDNLLGKEIRVEFWFTKSVQTMIYRMLVLNTGQVPWTLPRQISVVYAPLVSDIKESVPEANRIFTPDDTGRRVKSGEYSGSGLVEMYLSFSLRKVTFDSKEALSDEFSRMDIIDNLSEVAFQQQFHEVLRLLISLDTEFSRFEGDPEADSNGQRFSKGRNIFDSQPARIGFAIAVGQFVLGRVGLERSEDDRAGKLEEVKSACSTLVSKMSSMSSADVGEFLALDVLSEVLDKRVGQVGRYERTVFFEAFLALITEKGEIPNLEPLWRAN